MRIAWDQRAPANYESLQKFYHHISLLMVENEIEYYKNAVENRKKFNIMVEKSRIIANSIGRDI